MADDDGFSDEVLDRVGAIVSQSVTDDGEPGAVVAIARGDAVHVFTAGAMAVGGPPMARDTLFRITSNTKPMTAATILSLVDDGVLGLGEPIDRLLPELADRRVLRHPDGPLDDTVPAERPITTRDLLTFTWGFGMQGAMFLASEPWPIQTAAVERKLAALGPPEPDATPDPDTWLARFAELPLMAQPGERWLYQAGSQVLGLLASRAAGAPFAEVMRARVFDPLGMGDTAFFAADTTRLATAYQRIDGELHLTDEPTGQWSHPPAFADGGAGLVSSVDDMVAFGRMLARGGDAVLRPETVAEMTRNQLSPAQLAAVWPGFSFLDDRGWGYGVSVLDDGRYTWDGGFGTTWSNVPSEDLTVVALTQCATDHTGMRALGDQVLAAARLT